MPSPLNRDIIFDLGPHPVDISNYLLGKWPIKVTCKGRAYRRKALEELAYCTLEYDDELLVNIEMSWLQPDKYRQLTLVGSDRCAVVDCLNQTVKLFENKSSLNLTLAINRNNTIYDELKHFEESVSIRSPGHNNGTIGAKCVTVLEQMKRSVETNRTVLVDFNALC